MMKKLTAVSLFLAAPFTLAGTAIAQDSGNLQRQITDLQNQLNSLQQQLAAAESNSGGDAIVVKWEPAPSISSPDGRFEMNMRGRLFVDSAWVNDAQDNENTSATEFRAARLGIEGKAWKDVKYKFEIDFAGDATVVKDAYVQWSGPVNFLAGQFKTPNSLEEDTSSRYITFMERASFTDAFDLARQIGFGISTGSDNYTAKLGVFRGANGVSNEDEGLTFAGRVTYGPQMDDTQLHLGAHFRYRDAGSDQSNFRYRQRPHSHLARNRYVATARLADNDSLIGAEIAAVMGPISLQGEWVMQTVKSVAPIAGFGNPTFTGGYFEASYFVTGEKRAYDASKGSFQRIKVDNPVFSGGSGAVQLAVRFDRIDLTDEGIFGGEQNTYVFGANWYLNRHARVMVNYSHSTISNATDVALNDANGANSVNTFGLRAQVDW